MKFVRNTTFLLFALFWATVLPAEIYETSRMDELYGHLEPGMLVVFDIDNTLIEPVQELGSNQWFENRIKEYFSHGYSNHNALHTALKEWIAIQHITFVKLVEPGIDEVVKDLQGKGYTVMGLTTRDLTLSDRTAEQLQSVGIDLSKTAPTQEEVFFMNERGVLFHKGSLFTAATHKGEALHKFLEISGYQPSSVMFINDKYSHLIPVEEYCSQSGIPFVGLRYGHTDEKVKNFCKQIADVQFYHFGHILSNESAERILHERD